MHAVKSITRTQISALEQDLGLTVDILVLWSVCSICMCGHHIQQSRDQPGKVANPARGKLYRESEHPPVPVRAQKFGLARRVHFSGLKIAVFSMFALSELLLHFCKVSIRLGKICVCVCV